ncbi:hypothetical protein [Photobacterium toruni]|uniref:Bacteriocin class II with double-glycine leader peptide n=1 Tax=Photobacterium toruni TaxID=1935446 RepID=A0A1T4TW79_9GAMM|nr:hypothetical protein [Photobacterium toruni]SKA44690.1 hypothetical protein CZ814_02531 [Photobacterium toruni]
MYNLSVDEISIVDGGGDGGFIQNAIYGGIAAGAGYYAGAAFGPIGVIVVGGIAAGMNTNSSYSNAGVGTGTSQTYGGNGLSVGGQMMGAGRSF